MSAATSPLRSLRAATLVAAALAALASANALGNGFAYDDVHIVQKNPDIRSLRTLPEALVQPYWPGDFSKELGLWRPVTTGLLGIEYALVGERPMLYHAVNVALHALASALVVLVLAELMPLAGAFVAGLLFAVHPVHVEAVANVVGVAELIGAVLCLAATRVHLRAGEVTGWGRALTIALLYGVAFGAKESAAALPGLLFLVDAARRRIGFGELPDYVRRRWRPYAAMAVVAAGLLAGRLHVLGSVAHPFAPLGADILTQIPRIWTLAEVWSHYVRLMVFPLDLSADYSPNVIPISMGWHAANLVGLVLALGVLGVALALWRREAMAPGRETARTVSFGVVWFLVAVSPVANVVFLSGVLLAERNLYLPSVGFTAIAGWMAIRLWRTRARLSVAAVVVVVTLMGWRSWLRTPTWRNTGSVITALIRDYPFSGRAQWMLGILFFERGNVHQGLVAYRAGIGILGAHYPLLVEVGKKLMARGEYESARRLYEMAWRSHPEIPLAPELLAVAHSQEGHVAETERFCRVALALDDREVIPWHLLAWALTEQGRWDEASEARRQAIALGESDAWQQWVSLAYLRDRGGDTVEVRAALDSAAVRADSPFARFQIDSLRAAFLGGSLPSRPDSSSPPAPRPFP